MNTITGTKLKVFGAITLRRGDPPSCRELAAICGLVSPKMIHGHIDSLVAAGLVRRLRRRARSVISGYRFVPASELP